MPSNARLTFLKDFMILAIAYPNLSQFTYAHTCSQDVATAFPFLHQQPSSSYVEKGKKDTRIKNNDLELKQVATDLNKKYQTKL